MAEKKKPEDSSNRSRHTPGKMEEVGDVSRHRREKCADGKENKTRRERRGKNIRRIEEVVEEDAGMQQVYAHNEELEKKRDETREARGNSMEDGTRHMHTREKQLKRNKAYAHKGKPNGCKRIRST